MKSDILLRRLSGKGASSEQIQIHRNTCRGLPALAGRGMHVLRQQDSRFPLSLLC